MFVREEGWRSKKVSDLFQTVEELDHHELFDTITPLLIRVIEGKITYTSRPGAAYGKKISDRYLVFGISNSYLYFEWMTKEMQRVNGPHGWHSARFSDNTIVFMSVFYERLFYIGSHFYERDEAAGTFVLKKKEIKPQQIKKERLLFKYYENKKN